MTFKFHMSLFQSWFNDISTKMTGRMYRSICNRYIFVIELRSLFSSISQRKLSSRLFLISFPWIFVLIFFSCSAKSARQDPVSLDSLPLPPLHPVAATMRSRDHVARSRKLEHFHVATRRTGSSFFSSSVHFSFFFSLFLSFAFLLFLSFSISLSICL